MDFLGEFNFLEACLWFLIAAVFFYRGVYKNNLRPGAQKIFSVLSVVFVVFGISDLIEMKTGAWWRPRELFFMKAACVAAMTTCFLILYRKK